MTFHARRTERAK
jgi:hypothetical protein